MESREKELLWVRTWQEAGPVLDELRREEICRAETARAILQLEDAFQAALLNSSPRATSGLVEQQKWFARWRP